MGDLVLEPISFDEACAFVLQHHRHHLPSVGHKFSLGCVSTNKNALVGVAVVGRPVARHLDNGITLEVLRVATDGTKNACSFLYGACRRATFALGYRKLITYTLKSESGTSLRASGWKCLGEAGGGSWSVPSRPRIDKHPTQLKIKWEASND